MKINSKLLAITLSMPLTCMAGIFGPSNFEECILEKMKGITSDEAAKLITYACHEKFDQAKSTPKSRPLSPDQLSKIDGRGGPYLPDSDLFSVSLYNGNSKIYITKVFFQVETLIDKKKTTKQYEKEFLINPLSTGSTNFTIIKGDKNSWYKWGITDAEGYTK